MLGSLIYMEGKNQMKNVLTLFNGISACHLALDKAGLEYGKVYYAEIDKYANKVTEQHYPQDIALGDVTKWQEWNIDWSSIDLVTAGFPCQAWSVAGQQQGDKDPRGMLFWTMLDIISNVLKHNPSAKFMMENVKMKKDFEQYITHHTTAALGYAEKTLINSALVSAQNRNRYYWTNFSVTQPQDKGILLRDILESGESDREKSQTILATIYKENAKSMIKRNKMGLVTRVASIDGGGQGNRVYSVNAKSPTLIAQSGGKAGNGSHLIAVGGTENPNTLTTVQKDNVVVYNTADNDRIKGITEDERGFRPHKGDKAKSGISECGRILKPTASKTDTVTTSHAPKLSINGDVSNLYYRKLTPLECERLQTFPDNWTDCISNTQRYKAIGNAWTVDVIAHIFSHIKETPQ